MALYLTNDNVTELLSMQQVIDAMETLFVSEAIGTSESYPRQSLNMPKGWHRVMCGAAYDMGFYGLKSYGAVEGRPKYRVFVYSMEDGRLVGFCDAKIISMMRTAAVSAVAVNHMAKPDATTLGIIGTGFEARGQVEAISKVRDLSLVKAYSRGQDNRRTFAQEMSASIGVEVQAVSSAEAAVADTDIVVTATKADDPVLNADWLAPGAHICAVGATNLIRRELDVDAVAASDLIAVESLEQSRDESGELVEAVKAGTLNWDDVVELKDIVSGKAPGRPSAAAITQSNTLGIAAEDIVTAGLALMAAEEQGVGTKLPIE